ncbi:MAG TPA: hypothetical protein VGF95_03905 [Solirubrobacteraceae bacterium]|jgi:hypothetical protein
MTREERRLIAYSKKFDRSGRRKGLPAICVGIAVAGIVLTSVTGHARVANAASSTPQLVTTFGAAGGGADRLATPRGIAINEATGDVYVADQENARIDEFSSWGQFIRAFGKEVNKTKVEEKGAGASIDEAEENVCTQAEVEAEAVECKAGVAGAGAGAMNHPEGISVNPINGDVYIMDFSNHRVDEFTPQGTFLLSFGKEVNVTKKTNICTQAEIENESVTCGVGKTGKSAYEFESVGVGSFTAVSSNGEVIYVAGENRVQKFEPSGEGQSEVNLASLGKITSLAVNSTGSLYVVGSAKAGIAFKYNSTGIGPLAEFVGPSGTKPEVKALAVDPSGNVYVGGIASKKYQLLEYGPVANELAEIGSGVITESTGVGATAAGTTYVSNSEASKSQIFIFGSLPSGEPPLVRPAIDSESSPEIHTDSAALSAEINPEFLSTTYYVQYVNANEYESTSVDPYVHGARVPVAPSSISLGGGEVDTDQLATVTLQGLLPGTTYHYRFVAESPGGQTQGPDETFSTFPESESLGLPDGRVYEQVSASQKNGNNAGVEVGPGGPGVMYAVGSENGERVVYYQIGPSGETDSGADFYSVSTRNAVSGWSTKAALPPGYGPNASEFLGAKPHEFIASADLSRFLFDATGSFSRENPSSETAIQNAGGMYRAGEGNPAEAEWWITRPAFESLSEAKPEPGHISNTSPLPVGGSPSLSTVYFAWEGTLVPEDGSGANGRAGNVTVMDGTPKGPSGFFEWQEGALRSAGILPKNSPYPEEEDPYGAVPAVTEGAGETPSPFILHIEVSEDGTKAFFVSPQPNAGGTTPTELYVREQTSEGPKTVLVSRDELTGGEAPGSGAEEAVVPLSWYDEEERHTALGGTEHGKASSYVYAAPDGSRAFFESEDYLTEPAEEAGLAGAKTYEFDTSTATVKYLPGVMGTILASSQDGSKLIFEDPAAQTVELWSGGPQPTEVGSWPGSSVPDFAGSRANTSGEVFVFDTSAPLRGASATETFNNSAEKQQIYQYSIKSGLRCISCAPDGVTQKPVSRHVFEYGRVMSAEGERVFFSTSEELLPQDTNGVEDVYEWERQGMGSCASASWEGGCIYLISSGTDSDPSFYLDNDEGGENVFFATAQGLVNGDTDGSYDVYDARVNGGFPPSATSECESGCDLTGGTSPILVAPVSSVVGPSGNLLVTRAGPGTKKKESRGKARARKLSRALRACKRKPLKKRTRCMALARKRYAARRATRGSHRRGQVLATGRGA